VHVVEQVLQLNPVPDAQADMAGGTAGDAVQQAVLAECCQDRSNPGPPEVDDITFVMGDRPVFDVVQVVLVHEDQIAAPDFVARVLDEDLQVRLDVVDDLAGVVVMVQRGLFGNRCLAVAETEIADRRDGQLGRQAGLAVIRRPERRVFLCQAPHLRQTAPTEIIPQADACARSVSPDEKNQFD